MIAILVPSRGRPEQLKRMIESVKATSNSRILIYLGLSVELTPEWLGWVTEFNIKYSDNIKIVCTLYPDNMPTAHKWNLLAEEVIKNTDNKLFMLGADDMIFATPYWDEALINHYNSLDRKQHVYHLQDSRDKDGTPHPIMTREYVNAMGYFVPPQFLHWFIDSWTVEIAKTNNCFTHFHDYELIHDKPSDKGNPDETHSRIRDFGWHERDQYVDKILRSAGHLEFEKRRLWSVINHNAMAA